MPDRLDRSLNHLLSEIPAAEWDRLKLHAQSVTLAARTVLYARHEPISQAYFIQRGYVSAMIEFADGFQAETGQMGSEGMVGVPLVHGARKALAAVVVQAPSTALRISANAFQREIRFMPTLERGLLTYSETLRAQAMQLAACNGHHGLDARLARCLLSIHDRFQADEVPVTHEILGTLLCAHRPSVSVAAKRLQNAGLIRYAAGSLVIADRPGLERASCECYAILREQTCPKSDTN